ncbi:MAG: hypothetical protein COZ49_04090 [Candidatus Yonathbacteria bacterium CG_4_10_14_3_um_filter_47_65]|uniref:DoxX family protein n=2 Tax=Parcubacteria group TaxID=1794811 RepID=A0A2M8D5M7_9BACT|nr:MAG: hypothetical protein AUJ44_01490 [Candidatus Nomurabacteria bacterium CG1_02_47_685]PIP03420.1 MAG: hypothetical protein COX54_03760 [Candidatus Yonathbacteria bacterium CG23_combo_of_CG06-09_8_20_14_all_46_18]PIQ32271.1 MAG: hypothetical protein COW61_01930 [Candidatus Yonathbacteria bacterium CG17_big_fil_post_rev_8_21_14_2_50_46_19]PIX56070.1 MAG: hypothetical protein COZ49_04090 [Candidatus Yonathbacteria bacterium CG_4_10_14_3_um_filter_47_65]PIY57580.1 MAG: hypothetical protein CO
MLSVFPSLFTFWIIAPLILRVAIGFIFVYFGVSKIWKEKKQKIGFFKKIGFGKGIVLFWIVSALEITGGVFLVFGFLTQLVVLVLLAILLYATYIKIHSPKLLTNTLEFYILALAVLIALLFLGSGAFAIDLPL